ncbi:MAG: type III-A CRISPR-associated protein Cas10/Csm1, partial [Rhodocyclaceae bacterium]
MPQEKEMLTASCRVALAGLLHDLGKFAERARLEVEKPLLETWKQLDCPHWEGRPSHIHAAYTTAGFRACERQLPKRERLMAAPFAGPNEPDADDSLINAAARHHRPQTFLQWIIATADRLASGFEREEFARYNQATDTTDKKLDHYTTRLWPLLEVIRLAPPAGRAEVAQAATPEHRYPLKALSPAAIFPVPAKACETADKAAAQADYLKLWQVFKDGLDAIPASHRDNLPLWLDHFDSLWLAFTHAIPSATAGNTRPDVSLYDHSRTTAALAVALWRFHADQGHDANDIREELRAQWDRSCAHDALAQRAWNTEKFLLIQGDFTGIQEFIFAGGESQRQVARLLRGRSFYVSLLTELAALKVLEALDLPPTSQVVNAAGKFLIVAPNTERAVAALRMVQAELDRWFLEHTWGQSGINLAWLPACPADFRQGGEDSPFRALMRWLFEQLEVAKLRRFDLCGATPPEAMRRGFLDRFTDGECRIDGRSPASIQLDGQWVSDLAWDQIHIGKWLANQDRLLVTRSPIEPRAEGQSLNRLRLPIFGYHVLFTGAQEASGKFGDEAQSGNLLRAWDFSLPESAEAPLWNGYARRAINAFVPKFRDDDLREAEHGKYDGLSKEDRDNERFDASKTLNHLARDDRRLDEKGRWVGAEALMTLKGDIDNLGLIFQQGLARPTFARMATLSRQ